MEEQEKCDCDVLIREHTRDECRAQIRKEAQAAKEEWNDMWDRYMYNNHRHHRES